MKRYALLFLLLPLACLAADRGASYACDDGSHLEISFLTTSEGRPQVFVRTANTRLSLPQVATASGALYRSGNIRLHSQGTEIRFEDGKDKLRRCQPVSQSPTQADPAKATDSSFLEISGRIFYFSRSPLPPDATLVIRIQDIRKSGSRTLAEQQIEVTGQAIPIAFQTTIDRDLIDKKARITVTADIEHNGTPLFSNRKPHPALSHGQPVQVDMQLQPVNHD